MESTARDLFVIHLWIMNDHNDPNPNPLWIILDPLMDFFFSRSCSQSIGYRAGSPTVLMFVLNTESFSFFADSIYSCTKAHIVVKVIIGNFSTVCTLCAPAVKVESLSNFPSETIHRYFKLVCISLLNSF